MLETAALNPLEWNWIADRTLELPYGAEEDNLHRIRKLERKYHFNEDDFSAEHAKEALAATANIAAFDS